MLARFFLLALAIGASAAAAAPAAEPFAVEAVTDARATALDARLAELVAEHRVTTAGAAIIRDGQVVWTGYFGEQAPGIPASRETMFNVASITKTATAETVLRLVDAGRIGLDEPMAEYWIDPDLAGDPRVGALTPRLVLTHTTGFPNWRFFLPSGRLEFLREPGAVYGYSGEGFEYLRRFLEARLEQPFEELVADTLFAPLGIENAALSARRANYPRIARPIDSEGEFHGYYCRPGGDWCREEGEVAAADEMVVTVEDYARLLIAAMEGEGYAPAIAHARNAVLAPENEQPPIDCRTAGEDLCPARQGYGLGWRVLDYGEHRIVAHGGSDWAEMALAYFIPERREGVILFLNAPNRQGLEAIVPMLGELDPGSPMLAHYAARLARGQARD